MSGEHQRRLNKASVVAADADKPITAAILTKHGKAQVLAPLFHQQLGWQLRGSDGFDTDKLGMFSGEIPRTMTPLECATEKAQLALAHSDAEFGLGSEGSFNSTYFGLMVMNQELLVLRHRHSNFTVVASAQRPVAAVQRQCRTITQMNAYIDALPPGQKFIAEMVAPETAKTRVAKGLSALSELLQQLPEVRVSSDNEPLQHAVTLSWDFRAHNCPERQHTIARAGEDLLRRLQHYCPHCECPNFVAEPYEKGLPCEVCGSPTQQWRSQRALCQQCRYAHVSALEPTTAAPDLCDFCNP